MLPSRRTSGRRPSGWLLAIVLIGLAATATAGEEKSSNTESKTVQPSTTTYNATPRDEIYIDDEGIEGSGGRGEIHDDLEKEPDFSGSGFGPDDEDSTTDRHHSTSGHQTSYSSSSGVGGNSGGTSNTNTNRQDINNRKETTRVTEYDLGSAGESGVITKDVPKSGSEIDLSEGKSRNPSTDQGSTNSEEVLIMNTKNEDRTASFFAQPGILAAVIGGAVVGLLCAILVVMFIVYRMRKKDEGSYALDEPKRSPALNTYAKNGNNREFYA
ncbi:syndecan isoform X3 [Hermetia illucens]|uniref:syndecan isoform X3 n=1 Tax=Hermetia illucens TaxID=343691 RepID=UPI0018CC0BFD|nr:syndecan isoform X3 [Hermetia illucens]